MKKLFFFATVAIVALAGCRKQNDVDLSVNQDSPVAMQLGATTATYTVTKAAVTEWDAINGTPVNVYGLENTATGYEVLFANYPTVVLGDDPLEIYDDATVTPKRPYFYEEGKTYDFFGYYYDYVPASGDNFTVTPGTLTNNEVVHQVKFDGSNDIMYAHTDKSADIVKAAAINPAAADVTFADVYSAWAARRSVQPNLVFNHALSRFNFIVTGQNVSSNSVTITGIYVKSVNTGKLKVVGDIEELGFTADDVAATDLYLKNVDNTPLTATPVVKDTPIIIGGVVDSDSNGTPENTASLMVAPGEEELEVVVTMVNNGYNGYQLPNYEFTVKAEDVERTDGESMATFKAGEAYNINIFVYGPEEIVVTASLTDWNDAGEYTYDPDNEKRPGSTTTTENVDVSSTVSFFSSAADMTAFQTFYGGKISWSEAEASGTLPWVGFKLPEADTDMVYYIKCKYDSNYVVFNEPVDGVWYDIVSPYMIKITLPAGKTIVSFEVVAELGLEATVDGSLFEFEVTKEVTE